jgi:Fic family protein
VLRPKATEPAAKRAGKLTAPRLLRADKHAHHHVSRLHSSAWDLPPVHLASYVMWKLNWIHPFFGGNGRTARAASYLVLCARLGFVLPGRKLIPELILERREPYYDALRAADGALAQGATDLSAMENLMSALLSAQLVQIHEQETGIKPPID